VSESLNQPGDSSLAAAPSVTNTQSRSGHLVNVLYVLQILLCIAILVWPKSQDCKSCVQSSAKPAIALLGLFIYSLLLGLRASYLPNVNHYLAPILLAAHLVLVVEMGLQRAICIVCIGAALASLGIFLSEVRTYRQQWLLGAAAIAIVGLSAWLRPVLALEQRILLSDSGHEGILSQASYKEGLVNVLVVVKRDCKYCEEFKDNYAPRLKTKFGNLIDVRFIYLTKEAGNKGDIKTPMIVVGRSIDKSRVIEGLPSYDMLDRLLSQVLKAQIP